MKTKKIVLFAFIAFAAAFVILAAIWAKGYYENRYVGSDYYAMVPSGFDVTPEMLRSMSGEETDPGKEYVLEAFNERGDAKTVEFFVYEGRRVFPQPGEYLYISASPQLVLSWKIIAEADVPAQALDHIKRADDQ